MAGNIDTGDLSRERLVALLESVLDKAMKGDLGFICIVHDVPGTDDVRALWQGTDTPHKIVAAAKGLDALRNKIIETNTKS